VAGTSERKRKRSTILASTSVMLTLGMTAYFLLQRPWQPTFQGKTLGAWIDKFDYDRNFVDGKGRRLPEYAEDIAAIKTFSPNAIPVLLGLFQAQDISLRLRIQTWARRFYPSIDVSNRSLIHFFQTASDKRELALEALLAFGNSATEALPAYRAILKGENSDLKLDTIRLVASLGTNGSSAYPEIMTCVKMRGSRFQLNALNTIASLGVVTPELTKTLLSLRSDPDEFTRQNAENAIQRLGLENRANSKSLPQPTH
jgi:hypothetical protein